MQPKEAVLCTYCIKLTREDSTSSKLPFEHWETLARLRSSSVNCAICKILIASYDEVAQSAINRFEQITEDITEQCRLGLNATRFMTSGPGPIYRLVDAGIHLPNQFVYVWKFHIAARAIPAPSTLPSVWENFPSSLETRLSKICDWLHICQTAHPQCGSRWQCQLPSRLLDLGDSQSKVFKLLSTEKLVSNETQYTTLSYCWGQNGAERFTTTRKTLAAFQNGVSLLQLPKTYLDAALITKQLGLRYIWIDAICIVQDDRDDWATESSKMCDIYHGSVLSIAANDSKSISGGVFTSESPGTFERSGARALLRSKDREGDQSIVVHMVMERYSRAPLHERGWTLQELAISPRNVGVTNSELRWTCRAGTFWESGIDYVDGEEMQGSPPLFRADGRDKTNRIWWKWMKTYSKRRFTFTDDLLPAVLGIVQYYTRITQDVAILGLWESSLYEDLGWWRIGTRSERPPRPLPDCNLPSWSPFSCDQPIDFGFWNEKADDEQSAVFCLRLLEHEVHWEGLPYLSCIRSSSLLVQGLLTIIFLSEATEMPDCNPPYFNIDHEEVDFNISPLPWRCKVQWDREEYRPPQAWPCLLLRSRPSTGLSMNGETFLVLEPVEGDTYRRIGVGSLGRKRSSGASPMDRKFDNLPLSTLKLI